MLIRRRQVLDTSFKEMVVAQCCLRSTICPRTQCCLQHLPRCRLHPFSLTNQPYFYGYQCPPHSICPVHIMQVGHLHFLCLQQMTTSAGVTTYASKQITATLTLHVSIHVQQNTSYGRYFKVGIIHKYGLTLVLMTEKVRNSHHWAILL